MKKRKKEDMIEMEGRKKDKGKKKDKIKYIKDSD